MGVQLSVRQLEFPKFALAQNANLRIIRAAHDIRQLADHVEFLLFRKSSIELQSMQNCDDRDSTERIHILSVIG